MTETASPMHAELQGAAPERQTVRCGACDALFAPKKSWQKFCGPTCRNDWHRWAKQAREARELVRLALEGCDPTIWNPRARKLLGIK